jgi:hypothetical protein
VNHYNTLIRDYLIEHKSVSFEKIGSLTFTGGGVSHEQETPAGSVIFQYDKKSITTRELIDYIAQRTGKSKVLIESDLESHFELTRQFINIGKPYELERIGIISLSKTGEFIFTPYQLTSEEYKPAKRKQQTSTFAAAPNERKRSNRGALMFVAILIIAGVLGVIGWGAYNFFITRNSSSVVDSLATSNTVVDTPSSSLDSAVKKDNTQVTKTDTALLKTDSANYRFVFGGTQSLQSVIDHRDELRVLGTKAYLDSIKPDSITVYRLYIKMHLPSSDTAFIKDSLEKELQSKIKIVRAN